MSEVSFTLVLFRAHDYQKRRGSIGAAEQESHDDLLGLEQSGT